MADEPHIIQIDVAVAVDIGAAALRRGGEALAHAAPGDCQVDRTDDSVVVEVRIQRFDDTERDAALTANLALRGATRAGSEKPSAKGKRAQANEQCS